MPRLAPWSHTQPHHTPHRQPGESTARAAIRAQADGHVLAATLKLWYRRLPSPLIPPSTYGSLITIGGQGSGGSDAAVATPSPATSEQLAGLSALVRSLPQPNLISLHALLDFLRIVAEHEANNRMSAANLALVFAPTIARPPEQSRAATNPTEGMAEVNFTRTLPRLSRSPHRPSSNLCPRPRLNQALTFTLALASGDRGRTCDHDAHTASRAVLPISRRCGDVCRGRRREEPTL